LSSTSPNQTKSDSFDLTPEQSKFVRSKKRYVGYISGVGAGKTFAGIARLVRNMTQWNPGEMGAVIAPTRTMVVDVIVNEMRELNLFDKGFTYKSSHSEEPGIHGPNDSRALILSADNSRTVERLKGLNLAWWWIDEEAEVPPRAREILMQRLRTGAYRNGFITTTPKGHNHTYDFFVGDHDTTVDTYGSGTIHESDNRLSITGVPTWANPHTPEDYHEDMDDLPDDIRAQEVKGEFVQIGGGVFSQDMLHWIDPEDVSDTIQRQTVVGVDPAATADTQKAEQRDSDFWGVTVADVHKSQDQILVTDTAQRRGMTLKEGVDWIQSICQACENPQLVVEANQSQRWLQQELSDRGLQAQPVNTTQNKEDKLIDLSIPVANGVIQFLDWPDESNPHDELISQMLSWPQTPHDDLMDSLALIVNHSSVGGTSIFSGSYGGDDDLW